MKKSLPTPKVNDARPTQPLGRFLRRTEVEALTGLRRTTLRRMVDDHEFPAPVKLSVSGRAIAWLEAEVAAWQQERLANARTRAA